MIKANELRIGNWVYMINEESEDSPFLKRVTPSILSTAGDDLGIDFLERIPLTPEILEKCGFNMKSDDEGRMGNYLIEEYDNEWKFFFDSICISEIKYLHQFQNLYFALTGEELEINL